MGLGNFIKPEYNDGGKKQKRNESEELKKLKDKWVRAYSLITGRVTILSNAEISILKRLLRMYTYEEISRMMEYYFRNYRNLPFIKSKEIPKIRLLYYYRDDFYERLKNEGGFYGK
ncbi:MAG: hypothetical protein KatS3mg068_1508 [Candidatus Sericytochromatia bacterium]|nr:MAG: hypothetical protein KatS3mg068_1508 [Candidatus Sericytochromatia bacterium]